MKRFTVVWDTAVQDQLADLIVKHWGTSLAEQITSAADRIDIELATRANDAGAITDGKIRTIAVYPLIVEYEVRVEDRMAILLRYELAID